MRQIFLILIFFVSCTTRPSQMPPDTKLRKIQVNSKDEARKVIGNHVRFLAFLFEQSKDPYYGKLKWSEACLSENKLGKIEESDKLISVVSTLYLDKTDGPGACSGNQHLVVMLYCHSADHVKEIKIPVQKDLKIKVEDLCE